jgi:hypothetical protein
MDLGTTTITRLRAALITNARDSSKERDWAHAASSVITGCMVEPFLLSNQLVQEVSAAREYGSNFLRVWAPAGSDVLYTDRVIYRGITFEVWGPPTPWYDFDDVLSHINFLLRERIG